MPLNALAVDGYNAAISDQAFGTVDTRCKNVNGPTLVMATGQANALGCSNSGLENCVCGYETGQGYWQSGDIAGTLRAEGENRPSRPSNIICRKPENGGNGNGFSEELAYTQNTTGTMGVSVNTFVRRLLPVECERLMGFPSNWTRIVWKGKSEEECPDSHRYKACGNSMCVNVMRWIGMRIEQVERKMKND